MAEDPPKTSGSTCLDGKYANYFQIGSNAFEFLLEFGQYFARNGEARFHTRIVTSPWCAKIFLATLAEAMVAYEASYGPIVLEDEPEGD